MVECIINEIIDILALDDMLKYVENESKVKMYNFIDVKREDLIKLGKYVRNQNKELYKDSLISKKMGIVLKLMRMKEKIESKWEINTINNTHNIITDQLYSLKIVSKISNLIPDKFLKNNIKKFLVVKLIHL
jgi:hypothetical protein